MLTGTTSRSPVLSRRESPLPTQPSNQVAQRNVGSAEPRPLWDRVEKLQPRPGSGSSSGSSNSSSQAGSGDRFRPRSSSKSEGSPLQRPDNAAKKPEEKNLARPSRPAGELEGKPVHVSALPPCFRPLVLFPVLGRSSSARMPRLGS
ncbi:hypothetical protein CRUP_016507 [Coryphaenoides rupestris]|nr:hypothetical protein CRUP_016507 [Coryphaenoides rupestris]